MSENVLQTVQHVVQDVIAPDLRELKVRIAALEKLLEVRFETVGQKFDAVSQKFEAVGQRFDSVGQKFDSVGQKFEAVNQKFDAMGQKFDALDQKSEAQFKALMAAISESRAQAELTSTRVLASLSERVAVLESQRH